jgi:hypothetical protein
MASKPETGAEGKQFFCCEAINDHAVAGRYPDQTLCAGYFGREIMLRKGACFVISSAQGI